MITKKNPLKLHSILEYCKQIASYLILMYNFIFTVASKMEGLLVLRTPAYCSCFFMCSEVVSLSLRTWTDRHGSSNNAFVYLTGQRSLHMIWNRDRRTTQPRKAAMRSLTQMIWCKMQTCKVRWLNIARMSLLVQEPALHKDYQALKCTLVLCCASGVDPILSSASPPL